MFIMTILEALVVFILHLVEVKLPIAQLVIEVGIQLWNHISQNVKTAVSYSKFKYITKLYPVNTFQNFIPLFSLRYFNVGYNR